MQAFFDFAIFVFGLCIGSFLNVLIARIPKNETILGRSYCSHCKTKLRWFDLIPVLSFLVLRGRCRYCRAKISRQYPAIEISTALIFLLIFNFKFLIFSGFPIFSLLNIIYYWAIFAFLIVICISDLKYYIIPDKIVFPGIVVALTYQVFEIWSLNRWDLFEIWSAGWRMGFGIFPALFLLAIILFSRGRWMGMGDFKMGIFMGLVLGWPNILVAMLLAIFSGAATGLFLIILKKKKIQAEIPFAPFLTAGTAMALFWGKDIIDWYFNIIGF